jgi:hypothetical protein
MDGTMLNTWTLECSGRVIGAKSGKAVDNLLRLHKKKCDICRKVEYLCVDEGVVHVKHHDKKSERLRIEQTSDHHNKKLYEMINALNEV